MITRQEILKDLPAYRDEWIVINDDQEVKDIIFEVLDAHEHFRPYYDKIALYFYDDDLKKICDNLYKFLKREIKYKEETEDEQTTALPVGILSRGYGDCKHYSSFSGGVLDAIGRLTGQKIKWNYRFASYDILRKTPHHVFVVVTDGDAEYWIDPTPGADNKEPVYYIDKKPKSSNMALLRNIAGVNGEYVDFDMIDMASETVVPDLPDNLPADIIEKINFLLAYGVIDEQGNFNQDQLIYLGQNVSPDIYKALVDAKQSLEQASVNGLFGDIWRGIKKVTLAVPRGAFLSMVSLNMFGLATKLKQAMSTKEGHGKVTDKWYSLGGDMDRIKGAIENGYKKPKILGSTMGAAAAVPAWVATGGAIIAAILPLVNAILKAQQAQNVPTIEGYDPSLINYGNNIPGAGGSSDSGSIQQYLPYILGGGALLYLLMRPQQQQRAASGFGNNAIPVLLIAGAALMLMLNKGGSQQLQLSTAQKMQALNQWVQNTGETWPAFTPGEVDVVYEAYVNYFSKGLKPPASWPYYSQLVAISNKYGIFN